MQKLTKAVLSFSLVFFTACGTETTIDPNRGFDIWEYMTSASNYEVTYDVYENGAKTDYYDETHRQFGNKYERQSNSGVTTLFLNASRILMNEPNGSTNIVRFLHLGDLGIFQSPEIQICSLERFYDNYQNKGLPFHNVLQVNCTYKSGIYQEFYYAYNEGIVHIYEENNGFVTEYAKVGEREIF